MKMNKHIEQGCVLWRGMKDAGISETFISQVILKLS